MRGSCAVLCVLPFATGCSGSPVQDSLDTGQVADAELAESSPDVDLLHDGGDPGDPDAPDRSLDSTGSGEPTRFEPAPGSCDDCLGLVSTVRCVDLGSAGAAEVKIAKFGLLNKGSQPVALRCFRALGGSTPSGDFAIDIAGQVYLVDETAGLQCLPAPVAVPPGQATDITVQFVATNGKPSTTTVVFNPRMCGEAAITLVVNADKPVVTATPASLAFFGVPFGMFQRKSLTLSLCGEGATQVAGIVLNEATDASLAIEYDGLAGQHPPSPQEPLRLPTGSGETATVGVRYTPAPPMKQDDPGQAPALSEGTISFKNEGLVPLVAVPVEGHPALPGKRCPVPVVKSDEPTTIAPQTTLHLQGESSIPSDCGLRSYAWRVEQPDGNRFALSPRADLPNITHQAVAAGTYRYCLDVCDAQACSDDANCGTTSCRVVQSTPNSNIYCELTWKTPNDPDDVEHEGDDPSAGSDLDLHLLRAPGGSAGPGAPTWFDNKFDCYWFNPVPEWGPPGAQGNPRLDRDDVSGPGPEILNVDAPEDGVSYRLAVFYSASHGFGPTRPTVRCLVRGQPAVELSLSDSGIELKECDLWEVASIGWPSGNVTPLAAPDGKPLLTHGYHDPWTAGACP